MAKRQVKVKRPTVHLKGQALAAMQERILEWSAAGKTLRDFCRQPNTPGFRTVYNWLRDDEEFAAKYGRARAIGFDAISQECVAIADSGDEANVQHRKLRVWTRMQLLSKWDPGRFGDRLHVSGGVQVTVVAPIVRREIAADGECEMAKVSGNGNGHVRRLTE